MSVGLVTKKLIYLRCPEHNDFVKRLVSKLLFVTPLESARPELGPCWIWAGSKRKGYGVIQFEGKKTALHRVVYELSKRTLGDLEPDHLCKVLACCNPEHLEAVTHAENVQRQNHANRSKTHCINGHALTGENLVRRKWLRGIRDCRTCENERQRNRRAKAA